MCLDADAKNFFLCEQSLKLVSLSFRKESEKEEEERKPDTSEVAETKKIGKWNQFVHV